MSGFGAEPRLHPGITQEVAFNENQRGPNATTGEGEASEPELLFEGTAREVGLRFPEGDPSTSTTALAKACGAS